eukprot:10175717-Alexandrium_andersonii.AAC.1
MELMGRRFPHESASPIQLAMSQSAGMVASARSGSCLGASSLAWASRDWSSPSPGGWPPRQLGVTSRPGGKCWGWVGSLGMKGCSLATTATTGLCSLLVSGTTPRCTRP